MSMKETVDFPLMKHDVSRYILSPSHDLVQSSRLLFSVYIDKPDNEYSQTFKQVIALNKNKFLSDFFVALLFIRNHNTDLEIKFRNWFSVSHYFDMHYTEMLIIACKEGHLSLISDIQDDNFESDILKLTLLAIENFAFSTLDFIKKTIIQKKPEFLAEFKTLLSSHAGKKRNFLNLILANYNEKQYEQCLNILRCVEPKDFSLSSIVNLQSSRNKTPEEFLHSKYEVERFTSRFSLLIHSGFFDNDPVFVNGNFNNISETQTFEDYSLSYVFSELINPSEKSLFIELVTKYRLEK